MNKNKKLDIALLIVLLTGAFFSCKKSDTGPSVTTNILDYKINEIPVTQNYIVGAFYYNIGSWNANITEIPVVGKYTMPSGVVPPAIMTAHIAQAAVAGIDYFVFPFRSANNDKNNWKADSTIAQTFINVNTTTNMKFAMAYNWSSGSYSVTNTAPLEANATKLAQFFDDIMRVQNMMKDPNYMKVNGKTLLYIENAQVLYSNNNVAIYDTLRNKLSALGFTMYIVGMQDRWTPPARYPFRYVGCVDAIYHQCFSSSLNNWDRWYVLPQCIDQNWEYSRQYFDTAFGGISYVPNISPAYNWLINTPTSTNPNYPRSDSGAMYKQLCNVAKMNADNKTRLILVDSWNDWVEDMQLEAATNYGNLYLNITKQEFKVK